MTCRIAKARRTRASSRSRRDKVVRTGEPVRSACEIARALQRHAGTVHMVNYRPTRWRPSSCATTYHSCVLGDGDGIPACGGRYDNMQGTSVTNSWPSLGDVTDVWPQRSIWRTVIALHVAPRLLLVWNYAQYLNWRGVLVAPSRRHVYDFVACLCGAVHAASVGSLVMMACASRRHYPIMHDALLINWMWWSLLHMACTCLALRLSQHRSDGQQHPAKGVRLLQLHRSRALKETLLALSVAASIGIIYVGIARRKYCAAIGGVEDKTELVRESHDLFAISESVFMFCAMGFDLTILYDVPGHVAHLPWPL
ncbi:hypothetical protein HPB52_019889 [Rhipicephalus sanguineus]|uniref:CWH43-like N-terminal domain-containing protein n=1 Tax=Rhipicephalus sanguineus TaxID=34632 RepID=A0A9D4PDM4_RHISA|nr:hypothetical protein HPB52_019889 [Rhipicephalus sanguineus]